MSQPVTSEAARSLINGVLPMHSRKPDRIFIARPISCFFCFLASVRNGNFNGVCADFGNFFVAWHACSARHPLAGNNLRSSSDWEKIIRLSSRTMASESSRNTRSPLATRTSLRAPHRAADGLSHHFAAAQRPRRFRSKATSTPMRHATGFMSTRPK